MSTNSRHTTPINLHQCSPYMCTCEHPYPPMSGFSAPGSPHGGQRSFDTPCQNYGILGPSSGTDGPERHTQECILPSTPQNLSRASWSGYLCTQRTRACEIFQGSKGLISCSRSHPPYHFRPLPHRNPAFTTVPYLPPSTTKSF